jgi:hypothetical protein
LSDRNSCAVANGSTSVPEVLAPSKLESKETVLFLTVDGSMRELTVNFDS